MTSSLGGAEILGFCVDRGQRVWVRDVPEQLWREARFEHRDSLSGLVVVRLRDGRKHVFCDMRLNAPVTLGELAR